MATDRSKQYPKIVKDGKVAFVGTQGNREVTATGLAKGTEYAEGAFQLYWDVDNKTAISGTAKDAHIGSPKFTTKLSAPDAPTIKITPATNLSNKAGAGSNAAAYRCFKKEEGGA